MAREGYPNIERAGRSLSYVDGVRLNIYRARPQPFGAAAGPARAVPSRWRPVRRREGRGRSRAPAPRDLTLLCRGGPYFPSSASIFLTPSLASSA